MTDMSGHPRGGEEPNDPKWSRFHAFSVTEGQTPATGIPTLGLGSYRCSCCNEPYFCIAVVHPDGREFSILIPPDVMTFFLIDAEKRQRELGFSPISHQALSAITLVGELSTMTDTEADFLDGSGLRESCRLLLNGAPATVPRLYSDADRERAAAAMMGQLEGKVHIMEDRGIHIVRSRRLAMVDAVAAALGMTPAS